MTATIITIRNHAHAMTADLPESRVAAKRCTACAHGAQIISHCISAGLAGNEADGPRCWCRNPGIFAAVARKPSVKFTG
ncbi:hypothetical protein GCM10012319_17880 [Comamonas sp. KCTC 72670]|nr:hypothetical protein GCM10012319_17880 [Comamonas sp. KCTC 72670]